MKRYCVIITPGAAEDIEAAAAWARQRAPLAAQQWLSRLRKEILSLDMMPLARPAAPEAEEAQLDIRQLILGRRGGHYRVLFIVRGDAVYVLHVRHGARRRLRPEELRPPP